MSESEVESGVLISGGDGGTISEQETTETGSKRKKSLSGEDTDSKLQRCRERNRFHARNTRERKKNQIEMMLSRIEKLNEERAVLSAEVVDTTVADILMTLSSQEQKAADDINNDNNDSAENDDEKQSSNSRSKSNSNNMKSLDQICAHVMKELVDDNDIRADLELLNKDKTTCTSEELESIRRERNRLHAKKTRLRKKLMLQEMETNLLKLEDEVLNLRKKKELENVSIYGNGAGDQTSMTGNMMMNLPSQMHGSYVNAMMPMNYTLADNRGLPLPSVYDTEEFQNKQIEGMPQYVTIAVPYGMTMNGMPMYNCGSYDRSMGGDMPFHAMPMPSMQSMQHTHVMANGNLAYPRQQMPSNQSSDSTHSRNSTVTQSQCQPQSQGGQVQVQGQGHGLGPVQSMTQSNGQVSSSGAHSLLDKQHQTMLQNTRMSPLPMPTHAMSMQMPTHPAYMWPPYAMGMKTMNGQFMTADTSAMGGMQLQPGYSMPGHFVMQPTTSTMNTAASGEYYQKPSRSAEEDFGNNADDPTMPIVDCSVSSGSGSERRSCQTGNGNSSGNKPSSHKHGRERRIYSHHTESVEKVHFPDQTSSARHSENAHEGGHDHTNDFSSDLYGTSDYRELELKTS